MTFIQEIRDALKQGQDLFALDRKEYLNVYMWTRNERKKGKHTGIMELFSGEYFVWHEDYQKRNRKTEP